MEITSPNMPLIDLAVRMVVPMRREFGRVLDVQQFMHDARYAADVLAQALSSQVPRLRGYAEYANKCMFAARHAHFARPASRADGTVSTGRSVVQRHAQSSRAPSAFEAQRKEAVRLLLDQVGPVAEPLAIKIERAVAVETLRPLLVIAQQLIGNTRGKQAAQDYAQRCELPPSPMAPA